MIGKQIVLHSDLNCFYASVEMNEHPELRGKAMAVCGSTENRHGIVLTKSYEAKAYGVKTGQANWEARRACPGLLCVEPHYDLYIRYSKLVRSIYARYTDTIEPFGMDECWLSFDGCGSVEKDGKEIAEEIRRTVREETGLTVSIGVSFSKIFAKLGSDMKKPDAVTVLGEAEYKEKVWPLDVSELLYVGRATTRKLALMNVRTIGDLARMEPELIRDHLGKNGIMLWLFANGRDGAKVQPSDFVPPVKSVGHGATCVVDLDTEYQVWLVLLELAQDVGHRLMAHGLAATGVQITVKDKDLAWRQYVTFQEVLGSFTAYASNAPMRLNHLLQVSVFSRRDDGTHRAVMTRAISLLRAAGVRVYSYGPDDFEKDTGYHHIAVTCEWDERT